jgi:hypothetical protein
MLTPRKKLEIFVEAHAVARVEAMLRDSGFRGWSVFASTEGSGTHGSWRQTGVDEKGLSMIVAIGSQISADAALDWLEGYFRLYPGIVAVSEVGVMRAERF